MTSKVRLDIPLLLPQVTDMADACIAQLTSDLTARDGIEAAHVVAAERNEPAKLCLHFNPERLSLARIREIAHSAGAGIMARFGHIAWQVTGIGHERRARTVSVQLRSLAGVLEANASAAGTVHVEFDREKISEEEIATALRQRGIRPDERSAKKSRDAGYTDKPGKLDTHDDHSHGKDDGHNHGHGDRGRPAHSHDGDWLGPNTELIFALASGAALGIGFAIAKLVTGVPGWLPTVFYLAGYVFGGFFTLREAIDNLRLRRFEIDTLMLVAAAGAAALGAFAEGALLLFLFSLGHALEHYAMGRAKRAIEALAELAPPVAVVRRDGDMREIPVEELVIGDIVVVRPNERLPADGFLIKGASSVNQAPVTGESIPVDKRPVPDVEAARARLSSVDAASRVFAGTINGAEAIEIEVTHRSTESVLAKVVQMVSEAEAQKSPTQRFTEQFERIFVPAVLALAFILLFAWVVVDEPFRDSFYRAMAVLVAASPCALAIATPSAVLSGVARAARGGVLVKGGGPLENLGSLTAIAFDKTGTLTAGKPRITDILPAKGVDAQDLLKVAVAVESLSDHPLAEAIVRDGKEKVPDKSIATASGLKSLTGRGVTATLDGQTVWVGKAEMFGSDGVPTLGSSMIDAVARLREDGRTTMVVRQGDRELGVIGLMDTPRQAARDALKKLREIGITRMIMISGDHQKVADTIATNVGLDEAWGDLMPEDKVDSIKKLRAQGKVAMVGDGVNDAPAMASATVGIAMGAAGSDVALETADVALMADDLTHLPFAVGLSRQTRAIIRQNVVVSLGVVAILIPSTIFGLGIGPAVAMHEGSTLLVVFNALRLLAYRDPRQVPSNIPDVGAPKPERSKT